MSGYRRAALAFVFVVSACTPPAAHVTPPGRERFVSLADVDPAIQLDIRYYTSNNFMGRPVEGYLAAACLLTREAAMALQQAQRSASRNGYTLKIYDCYRPQRAVSDFVAWARDTGDTRMQKRFYPAVPKSELFAQGYIAERSGHSRGSTVDLTLVRDQSRQPRADPMGRDDDCRAPVIGRYPDNSIDMGTGYDCFDTLAHTDNPRISVEVRRNRGTLRAIMRESGFVNYEKEWWHYTLVNEPFPDTYFDFPVR